MQKPMGEPIDKELLDILVCPETKARVVQIGDWLYSTDANSRRRYPIRDGIPIMLIEESEIVPPDEYDKVMKGVTSGTEANEG